jgi:hypothetical protein
MSLPNHDSAETLSNKFADFFGDKIVKIRTELENIQEQSSGTPYANDNTICDKLLEEFAPATEDEIRKIMSSESKSCNLDPIPTWLLKDSIEVLLPTITNIVNQSLATHEMPDSMKEAIVVPHLKKSSLDPAVLKNYRPVSNLTFMSKLIERVVASRLLDHMDKHGLQEPMQSAYKKGHSTETALLKVQNDILMAIDSQKCVLVVLLDMSAAFDTVDHSILIERLKSRFGVVGGALDWFRSYLSNRKQAVIINGVKSSQRLQDCNVPQGSVLGPILFTSYTAPLGDIMRTNGMNYHLYADDTQQLRSFSPAAHGEPNNTVLAMENCITQVRSWMAKNFMKLNDEKTELMVIGSRQQLAKLSSHSVLTLKIGEETIEPSSSARNIGVVFDSTMSMKKHIDAICSSGWFHLKNIGKVRRYLNTETTQMLVHAFVSSKLDYCNCLLYGLPDKQIKKLQRLQNCAARIVVKAKKFDHITPVFCSLHWLPINPRIEFKILLMTYKALNGLAPCYIVDMLTEYTPARDLRSSDRRLLLVPKTKLKTYGDRAYCHAAPTLWNSLPLAIRTSQSVDMFKGRLKTYLFKRTYCLI